MTGEKAQGLYDVGGSSDFPEGRLVPIRVERHPVLVIRAEGRLHAVCGNCPHAGASLEFGILEFPVLTCTLHGWQFDIRDGRNADPSEKDLPVYPVDEADGRVYVAIP